MLKNKFRFLTATLLAAMAVGLASCDSIEAGLTTAEAETPLINVSGQKLAGNTLNDLYEEIVKAGNSNSEKILENILYKLAQSYFGDFYGEGGLRATVESNDDAKIKAYADAHSAIFGGEAKKVKIFYGKIKESLDKSFWSIVKNSSYQEHSFFLEKKFVRAMEKELYVFPELGAGDAYKDVQVLGYKSYLDVAEYFQADYLTFYKDYVERNLIKDVYRKALVEQHIISTNRNAIGRSNARKVQYIALGEVDGYPQATGKLVRAYAERVLMASDEDIHAIDADINVNEVRDLRFLDRLAQGYFEGEAANQALANALYDAAGFTHVTYEAVEEDPLNPGTDITVVREVENTYNETAYGALIKDYMKINDSRWADSSSSNDFTGGSAYTVEAGLEIKTNEILTKSNITEGWFVSSGLSDLPAAIRSRLTKPYLANDLDVPDTHNPVYVANYNGAHYLKKSTKDMGTNDDICFQESSKWYIVRVDEAVKGPKITIGGNSAYGEDKMDQIVADVAALIADGESYKKSARQYYVKNAALEYHDQDVYDYFEATFPDLFD